MRARVLRDALGGWGVHLSGLSEGVVSEATRRQNNANRVLAYLQAHGAATNAELIEIGGFRFGGREFMRGEYGIEG